MHETSDGIGASPPTSLILNAPKLSTSSPKPGVGRRARPTNTWPETPGTTNGLGDSPPGAHPRPASTVLAVLDATQYRTHFTTQLRRMGLSKQVRRLLAKLLLSQGGGRWRTAAPHAPVRLPAPCPRLEGAPPAPLSPIVALQNTPPKPPGGSQPGRRQPTAQPRETHRSQPGHCSRLPPVPNASHPQRAMDTQATRLQARPGPSSGHGRQAPGVQQERADQEERPTSMPRTQQRRVINGPQTIEGGRPSAGIRRSADLQRDSTDPSCRPPNRVEPVEAPSTQGTTIGRFPQPTRPPKGPTRRSWEPRGWWIRCWFASLESKSRSRGLPGRRLRC